MKYSNLNIRRTVNNLLLILSAILLSFSVNAQNKGQDFKNKTPEQRAESQTTLMKSKLKLDSTQVLKIKAINLKYAQKFEPIIKSEDSKLSRLKQAMALQKSKDAELKTVFTADQYKQYEQFENELKSRFKK